MGLYQIHQKYKDNLIETIFIAQNDIHSQEEMLKWTKDIQTENLLPKDYEWLICNEYSKFFILTKKDGD
jgi:hypothetical protein